jgi:hypothetical protein
MDGATVHGTAAEAAITKTMGLRGSRKAQHQSTGKTDGGEQLGQYLGLLPLPLIPAYKDAHAGTSFSRRAMLLLHQHRTTA